MNWIGSKTKAGAVMLAIGVAVYNTVELCPVSSWVPWIKYIGALISAAGGALGLVGIGGKVDKATAAVTSSQASAQNSAASAAQELASTTSVAEQVRAEIDRLRKERPKTPPAA